MSSSTDRNERITVAEASLCVCAMVMDSAIKGQTTALHQLEAQARTSLGVSVAFERSGAQASIAVNFKHTLFDKKLYVYEGSVKVAWPSAGSQDVLEAHAAVRLHEEVVALATGIELALRTMTIREKGPV